jgi:hypothetical protein
MGVVLCEKEKEAETKRRWNRRGRTRLLLSEEELESQRRSGRYDCAACGIEWGGSSRPFVVYGRYGGRGSPKRHE